MACATLRLDEGADLAHARSRTEVGGGTPQTWRIGLSTAVFYIVIGVSIECWAVGFFIGFFENLGVFFPMQMRRGGVSHYLRYSIEDLQYLFGRPLFLGETRLDSYCCYS